MRIYGLTGGVGSGKSEAARRFAEQGVPVIDADAAGHEVIGPGGAAAGPLVEHFGTDILTDGIIDRKKVSERVFGDPAALAKLNEIVHPAIFAEIAHQVRALSQAGEERTILDAALLAENGQREPWLEGLILVLCPREERLQRLIERRGMTQGEANRRIDAQTPPEYKAPLADWVIENTGPVETLHAQVDEIVAAMNGRK
ncbi:MAG: dephospho-CoA kinase [Candidatus Hydrogenedentota bacterium]